MQDVNKKGKGVLAGGGKRGYGILLSAYFFCKPKNVLKSKICSLIFNLAYMKHCVKVGGNAQMIFKK